MFDYSNKRLALATSSARIDDLTLRSSRSSFTTQKVYRGVEEGKTAPMPKFDSAVEMLAPMAASEEVKEDVVEKNEDDLNKDGNIGEWEKKSWWNKNPYWNPNHVWK